MVWRLEALVPQPIPAPIPFNPTDIRREMIIGIMNHFPEWRIVPLGMQEELECPFDLFLVKPVIKMVKTVYGKDSCTPHEVVKPEKLQLCAAVFIKREQLELPLELRADLQGWINYLWVCSRPEQLLNNLSKNET